MVTSSEDPMGDHYLGMTAAVVALSFAVAAVYNLVVGAYPTSATFAASASVAAFIWMSERS